MENLNNPDPVLIHDLDGEGKQETLTYPRFFTFLGMAIVAGVIVGFVVAKFQKNIKLGGATKLQKTAGIADKKTFKDKAEGVLKEGGVDGEGNFHLERPGGESQNVYLTSTTVDLSQYIGKKVRVWGETFKAEKAGWLMDVGLVELL